VSTELLRLDRLAYQRVVLGVFAVAPSRVIARGCPRHAVAALDGITGGRVDWADSKALNEWERTALELSEERSKLSAL
jgi:hypothetical protein